MKHVTIQGCREEDQVAIEVRDMTPTAWAAMCCPCGRSGAGWTSAGRVRCFSAIEVYF